MISVNEVDARIKRLKNARYLNGQFIDQRIIERFNQLVPFKFEDATLLVLALVGSASHNTYVPKDDPTAIDDIDYVGIIIPPMTFTLGLQEWEGIEFHCEELDCKFYSLQKSVRLLLKANPNLFGLLWLKSEHWINYDDILWMNFVKNRHLFSSIRAYDSFIGYAKSQMRKMVRFDIDTQNAWDDALRIITACGWDKEVILRNGQARMPTLASGITVKDATEAIQTLRLIHARHFQGYMGEKRKALVRKYGYDTKNASHLIRLMVMCCEFLETGVLTIYRTDDAQYFRDIKQGKYALDDIKEKATELFTRADQALTVSSLPEHPDRDVIDKLCVNTYLTAYKLI